MKLQKNLLHISRRAVMTLAFGASALLLGAVAMVSAYGPRLDDPSASDVHRGGDDSTFVVEVKTVSDNYAQNDVDPAEGNLAFSRGDTFIGDGIIYTDGSIPGGSGAEPINGARKLGEYVQRGVTTTSSNQFEKALAGVRDVSPHIEFATELFTFRDGSTILTDGLWPNAHFSIHRVVLGGTGRFRGVVGELLEENIGEAKDGFCNLRITFNIRKAGRDR